MIERKFAMVNKFDNDAVTEEEILHLSPSQARRLLGLYYEDVSLPSPAGGIFQILRVKSEDDGSGIMLLDCG